MCTLLRKCSVICKDYCSVHEMTMLINTKITCVVLARLHSKCAYKTVLIVLASLRYQYFYLQLYKADIQKDNRTCQKPTLDTLSPHPGHSILRYLTVLSLATMFACIHWNLDLTKCQGPGQGTGL